MLSRRGRFGRVGRRPDGPVSPAPRGPWRRGRVRPGRAWEAPDGVPKAADEVPAPGPGPRRTSSDLVGEETRLNRFARLATRLLAARWGSYGWNRRAKPRERSPSAGRPERDPTQAYGSTAAWVARTGTPGRRVQRTDADADALRDRAPGPPSGAGRGGRGRWGSGPRSRAAQPFRAGLMDGAARAPGPARRPAPGPHEGNPGQGPRERFRGPDGRGRATPDRCPGPCRPRRAVGTSPSARRLSERIISGCCKDHRSRPPPGGRAPHTGATAAPPGPASGYRRAPR